MTHYSKALIRALLLGRPFADHSPNLAFVITSDVIPLCAVGLLTRSFWTIAWIKYVWVLTSSVEIGHTKGVESKLLIAAEVTFLPILRPSSIFTMPRWIYTALPCAGGLPWQIEEHCLWCICESLTTALATKVSRSGFKETAHSGYWLFLRSNLRIEKMLYNWLAWI